MLYVVEIQNNMKAQNYHGNLRKQKHLFITTCHVCFPLLLCIKRIFKSILHGIDLGMQSGRVKSKGSITGVIYSRPYA